MHGNGRWIRAGSHTFVEITPELREAMETQARLIFWKRVRLGVVVLGGLITLGFLATLVLLSWKGVKL
jgi:hypothetical protein